MQLKLKRSQREGGIVGKNVIFCLDARVEFTPEEKANLQRYKLYKQIIYNSEASRKHLERGAAHHAEGSTTGYLRSMAASALAGMNLNISIEGLERGTHVECKSLDELLGAENAILTACNNLKEYLETAATFDGREVVVDYASQKPTVVAEAIPAPQRLVAPKPAPQGGPGKEAKHEAPQVLHRESAGEETAGLSPDPNLSGTALPSDFNAQPFVEWWEKRSTAQKIGVGLVILVLLFLVSRCTF